MGWLTEESQRKEIKDLKEEVFILKVLLAVTGLLSAILLISMIFFRR